MSVNLSYLEDCERVRPSWSPEDGVASSFSEFFFTMNEPLSFVWLAIMALFLWKRSMLFSVLLPLLSLWLWADWNWLKYYLDDDLYHGQLGGCVGSLAVTNIVLLTAFLLGILAAFWRWLRRT